MAQIIEQRGYPRVKYPLKVSCIGDYQVFEARADNLSLSGACLLSPKEFVPGISLGIIVQLPGARRFSVIPAEVVWSEFKKSGSGEYQYQVGVKYLYLLPDQAEGFKALLKVLRAG